MERFKLLIRIIISALVFLVPVFFTTVLSEYFELPKTFLIYLISLLSFIVLGLKSFLYKKVAWVRTPFDLALFLFLVSLALSTYFGANRIQSLMNGLAPLAAGILLYFIIVQLLDPFEEIDYTIISRVFIATTTLLALLSFLAYFNLHIFPFDFTKNRFFTPVGSDISLFILLGLAAPLSMGALLKGVSLFNPFYFIYTLNVLLFGLLIILQTSVLGLLVALPTLAMVFLAQKEELARQRTLLGTVGLVFLLVFILFYLPLNFNQRFVGFRNTFPRPVTLNGRSSWIVSIQTVRDYPYFGSGPATYLADFVRYKPGFLNYTPFWMQRFSAASGEPFQVLATLGLIGFLTFLFLFWKFVSSIVKLLQGGSAGSSEGFSIMSFLIALLFAVPNNSVRAVFFILLAVYTLHTLKTERKEYTVLPIVPLVLSSILSISLGILLYNVFLGEINFKRAIDAVNTNDAQSALQNLSRAINYNQYRDNYHLSLASLTYTLANNLAANQNLTDADRQTLVQLLNTSINEGKIAVSLDPFNGANLETLASIYRNIAGAVQDAANWAVVAYQQAIQIEPNNPNLHFQLGSLFYAAGNFEAAANYFSSAVRLKNDNPNYHYNLAWALGNRGLLGSAIDEMTVVTRLVPADSDDGVKASADLAEFQRVAQEIIDRANTQPSTQGQLEVAQPEGNLAQPTSEKVNLPAEASPSSVKRK